MSLNPMRRLWMIVGSILIGLSDGKVMSDAEWSLGGV